MLRPDFSDPIDLSTILWYPEKVDRQQRHFSGSSSWRSNLEKAAALSEQAGDSAQAVQLYEQAITNAQRDNAAYCESMTVTLAGASKCAEKLGRIEQAIGFLEQAGQFPKAAQIALKYGLPDRAALSFEKAGRFDKAQEISVDPVNKQRYATLKHLFVDSEA
jgi:tetratricopeptide (TPR) repeat protein